RHRSPAAALDHLDAPLGLGDDVDLRVLDALLGEQPLRCRAVAAERRRVHHDAVFLRAHLTRGRFSARQAFRPPLRLTTCSNPALRSRAAARLETIPLSHTVIKILLLCFLSAGFSALICASSMLRALTMCPLRKSSALRTSITTAPAFISRTACAGPTCVCPCARCRISKKTTAARSARKPVARKGWLTMCSASSPIEPPPRGKSGKYSRSAAC